MARALKLRGFLDIDGVGPADLDVISHLDVLHADEYSDALLSGGTTRSLGQASKAGPGLGERRE